MNSSLTEQLEKLKQKYESMGQDINAYLDGLLLSNYLTYWDYIHLDTLLSLQNPKTDYPDEEIFIMYHQITELYFKLALHEFQQIGNNGKDIDKNGHDNGWRENIELDFLKARIHRINSYFKALTTSFEIMIMGMEKDQFLRFRMALLPASGFQSAQYRMIEIASTGVARLINKESRKKDREQETRSIDELFEHIYWKQGATELATGKKTLTLKQFEQKYIERLKVFAQVFEHRNVWTKYQELTEEERQDKELIREMRQLDINVNVNWPLAHYKSAVRYLHNDPSDIKATGGTNWQKYLPPRMQLRIFYPELWSAEELESWGKGWVENVFHDRIEVKGA